MSLFSTCHRHRITTEIKIKEQLKFYWLFFLLVNVTEINRSGCYYRKPISAIYIFFASEIEDYRDYQADKYSTNWVISKSLIHGCRFVLLLCLFLLSILRYVRVTDRLGIQTNMADKYRCQEILAPGNIEDYCESNLTFPWLLLPLIWPMARGAAATADSHDAGVFLAH